MFCPICKAEYREGFTRCNDCDVGLVSSLEPPDIAIISRPVLAWRGDDPVLFSRVVAVLKEAEIPYFLLSDHDHLAFQPAIIRPRYGIFIRSEDAQRAEGVVRTAPESIRPGPEACERL